MKNQKSEIRKVGIFVETSTDYCHRILAGIAKYIEDNQTWSVFLEQNGPNVSPHELIVSNKWDGILYRHTDRAISETLLDKGVPAVALTDIHQASSFPVVVSDHKAIGVIGAQYLKKSGKRRFAFCGFSNDLWSRLRKESFGKTVAEYGSRCYLWESALTNRSADYWEKDIEGLREWIKSLPKPIGIMAGNDARALHVIEACKQLGLVIPDHVAVLGVDNEETLCNFSSPRITSILPDCEQIGFQAAKLLDAMMSGTKIEAKRITIKPKGIITRTSTDIRSVSDQLVVKAIKKFHRKDSGRRDVNDVAKELKISRRMLEKRFRKSLNRSSIDVMRWVLISRIQQLLVDTDYTLTEIADRTGFINAENMIVLFKSNVGISPGTYRLELRKHDLENSLMEAVIQ